MYIVLTAPEDTSYWDKHGMKLSLWIREEQDRSEMYCVILINYPLTTRPTLITIRKDIQ